VAIRITRHDAEAWWSVQDSGIGIPKDGQRRLFEKFYRAENALTVETEGTGLGLYLVRLVVEQSGGRIWCESEEGQGSTFVFTLPLPGEDR
jgi:signal transduction histidine kinase